MPLISVQENNKSQAGIYSQLVQTKREGEERKQTLPRSQKNKLTK
jgi:hypothetical protein